MKIGFTCGTFDLFHAGHVLMLKEAKEKCDYLVVGIQTNPQIDRPDKNKPVQSLFERNIQVKACKYVDKVVNYETEQDLENILATQPMDIRIMGADHKNGFLTGMGICEERGIEIYYNKIYLKDNKVKFSSTELKERIKKQ